MKSPPLRMRPIPTKTTRLKAERRALEACIVWSKDTDNETKKEKCIELATEVARMDKEDHSY